MDQERRESAALFAIENLKSKIYHPSARVAKLADAPDLGSGGAILRGSSPLPGTISIVEDVDLLWANQKICHFLSPVRLSVSHRRSPPRKAFSFLPCSIPSGN